MLDVASARRPRFDYGNNIRARRVDDGVAERVRLPRLRARATSAPCSAEGMGPFRWVALSGDPEDIRSDGRQVLRGALPAQERTCTAGWITLAGAHRISRACRRASAGWATASATASACAFNEMVRKRRS